MLNCLGYLKELKKVFLTAEFSVCHLSAEQQRPSLNLVP